MKDGAAEAVGVAAVTFLVSDLRWNIHAATDNTQANAMTNQATDGWPWSPGENEHCVT